jgi:hypothetical protein
LFLHTSVEELPSELGGVADEVHIHFLSGSFLRAVVTGEQAVLLTLRRICAPGAWLEVLTSLDAVRDRGEIERLGLPFLSLKFLGTNLIPRYRAAGFEVTEYDALPLADWHAIDTSWAQWLRCSAGRSFSHPIARAVA